MKSIVAIIFTSFAVVLCTSSQGLSVNAGITVLNLFPTNAITTIEFSHCGKAGSKQFVEVDKDAKMIYWEWKNKNTDTCCFGIRIPNPNLVPFHKEHSLKIVWNKNAVYDKTKPPQVKFVSLDKTNSAQVLVGDNYSINTNSKEVEVFRIPISDFYSRAGKAMENVEFLQFDAKYESVNGVIEIVEIGIEKDN